MKVSHLLVLFGLISLLNASGQNKRSPYIPDGAELIVDRIGSSFVCSNNGYYADQEKNCQIFHVCHSVINTDGTSEMLQWSFLCKNQTVFNQFSFTCAHPEDSIPCESAADFFNLNDMIGVPRLPFHFETDISKVEVIRKRPEIPGFPSGEVPRKYRGGSRIKGGQDASIYAGGKVSGGIVKEGYKGIYFPSSYHDKGAPLITNESGRPPTLAPRPTVVYTPSSYIEGGQDIYGGGKGSGGIVKGGYKGIYFPSSYHDKGAPLITNESGRPPTLATRPPQVYTPSSYIKARR